MDIVYEYLPLDFIGRGSVNGKKFTKMLHTDKHLIYKVEYMGGKKFDVFKRKFRPKFDFTNNTTDSGVMVEQYPSDEEFGIRAYQFEAMEKAYEKMKAMIANEELINAKKEENE